MHRWNLCRLASICEGINLFLTEGKNRLNYIQDFYCWYQLAYSRNRLCYKCITVTLIKCILYVYLFANKNGIKVKLEYLAHFYYILLTMDLFLILLVYTVYCNLFKTKVYDWKFHTWEIQCDKVIKNIIDVA